MSDRPEPRDVVISIRDVVVRFESSSGEMITVLDGVSFDICRGETMVIMGGSGGGKSTLLNCLIGELKPQGGSITYHFPDIGPVDIARASETELDRVRKRFGILFQSGALFSSLTVAENVALLLREHSHVEKDIIDIVVAMKLQAVHMLPHRDKHPSQLSGGQKKRAGLARATALDPEILFYDEPSAGLDPVTLGAIDELIKDLARVLRVTSVVVTHEMDSAFRIADRMVMLRKGRILRTGTRADFDAIRHADPASLKSEEEGLIHQFVTGASSGPLTDSDGLSEYEKILVGDGQVLPPRTRM